MGSEIHNKSFSNKKRHFLTKTIFSTIVFRQKISKFGRKTSFLTFQDRFIFEKTPFQAKTVISTTISGKKSQILVKKGIFGMSKSSLGHLGPSRVKMGFYRTCQSV